MLEQSNDAPCCRHSSPTTPATLPRRQPHRMPGASLLQRLRVHGYLRGCRDLVVSREVRRQRSFGMRRASFRIAPERPFVNTNTHIRRARQQETEKSPTRAVSYGSRHSYAFLAFPRILDAFMSRVSYDCGALWFVVKVEYDWKVSSLAIRVQKQPISYRRE
jgi:hypothetical protein